MSNYQVHFKYPDGRVIKSGAQVIGGPIRNRATLEEYLLRPHPAGTTIEKLITLDANGKPTVEGVSAEDLRGTPAPPPVHRSPIVTVAPSQNPSGIPGHLPPPPETTEAAPVAEPIGAMADRAAQAVESEST